MINLDPLRPYANLLRWGLIALLAVLLVVLSYRWGAGHWKGEYMAEVAGRAADNAAHVATIQRLADAAAAVAAAVAAKAKAASIALAKSRADSDTQYQKALNDAKRAERDLAAALRRGDVQLQPQWSCPATGTGAGGVAADAVQAGAAGRFNSAARIVAAADADAAVIEWVWNGWKADRAAVIAAGCAVEAAR